MSALIAYLAGLLTTPLLVLIVLSVMAIRSPEYWNDMGRKNR